MQRARSSGGGHASRLVAKRIWRTRSKSQSRASAGTTSIWTPMGNSTWMSVTGRIATLEPTTLMQLTELERLALQRVAMAKLHAMSLGCQIKIPKESSSTTSVKKRRPYLLKRKALSTGFFETKKEEAKSGTGGQVFGVPLGKCLENERVRLREMAEKEANLLALAAASGDDEVSLSRKSSQAGSHASFTSLLEGTKQSTTGSLESLNLDRKRPSLGAEPGIGQGSSTSLDLLYIDPIPQVPDLVSTCCNYLETNGLHTLGIFRVSSSKKRVRQLREEFDNGRDVNLSDEHCPHDVATLLKEFFRDLPEPLCTRELYECFIQSQRIRHRKLQFEALQYLIQLMPTPNRDTLHVLLNFLTNVAEHSADPINESFQGNKMDSSNLATLFAPNILHQMKAGSEPVSPSELAVHAEERIDVINVVRSMIDHNKDLFEVSPELLDDTYQHLMDSHPEALDILLRRRCNCTGTDELDLEVDTSSSVFEGCSETSSPLPRSPTEIPHDFERLRSSTLVEDMDNRLRRRDNIDSQEISSERTRRRRRHEDEDPSYRSEKRTSGEGEDRGWFRRREKSGSREIEKNLEDRPNPERNRWFRRREKTTSKLDDKKLNRQGSEKKDKHKSKLESRTRDRISSQESIDSQQGDQRIPHEMLKVPEPTVRRLSSPEIGDNCGVITASLKIPVPLSQQASSLAFRQETDIPYIEDSSSSMTEEAKRRLREGSSSSRQRTGSNDSYLGEPITGTMSFQPLTKRNGDKQSHDSLISSSSVGIYTMSPSERNTPNSDYLYASGTSSPLSGGAMSPPMWLSPDSGTPGLSPPSSPPPNQRRRNRRREEEQNQNQNQIQSQSHGVAALTAAPLTHSATHTFGAKPTTATTATVQRTRDKTQTRIASHPIGRSQTSDAIKFDVARPPEFSLKSGKDDRVSLNVAQPNIKSVIVTEKEIKRPIRRRYVTERHHTGHLPDVSNADLRTTESSNQLWKRWEIIASDPTEPETYV